MNDRIIEIENYWARVVRDTAEFQQIADAENPEFNTVLKCLYNILKDGFINDLTENGAMRWEKILELPVSSTATLEERKVQILTYLSIRRPYTWRVLKRMLTGLLGEGNFKVSLDNDTQTLRMKLASTVESMREKIDELCARVIPQNLVIEVDEFPLDYTRVEYLLGDGKQRIHTDFYPTSKSGVELDFCITKELTPSCWLFGNGDTGRNDEPDKKFSLLYTHDRTYPRGIFYLGGALAQAQIFALAGTRQLLKIANGRVSAGNGSMSAPTANFVGVTELTICSHVRQANAMSVRWYGCKLYENGELKKNFIPAVDKNTGTPGMFDTVSRVFKTNLGTGDFSYPTNAAPVMTLDLDEKFYAQMTEHGIRRLYHVPKGYTGTKDEYAAEHGFKEILEPPMPLEGYWVPEWKETETQLICEWVETEPPTEEGIEND